ncbi:Os11g0284400 [Oryza sativa Japonica Group]|uniref:Os11g0284400 protein n=1 Tax=Oryza sativa subsp. japonica TaxID=39947 RepID=A0A0P0Y1G2_ORYSJ|nr:Os11g0284400 [Oryza sativa Japonica Group]
MGYRGPTAKIFILLSLLSLTFSAEPRKEEFVNHSVVKMFQMAAVETEPSTFYGSQSSISVWEPYLCTGRPPRYTGAVVVDPDMYGDNHAHFEIAWIWDVWVLLFGEELVGYWPGELFTDLSGAANMIGWMGVASAATGEPFPPMGSGYSPDEGEGRAAFFTDVNAVLLHMTAGYISSLVEPDARQVHWSLMGQRVFVVLISKLWCFVRLMRAREKQRSR